MKIGVLISFRGAETIREEFDKVRAAGLGSCQLCCWDAALYTDENAKLVLRCSEESGVEVSALWAGWTGPKEWNFKFGPGTLGLVPKAYRFQRLKELFAASDFAALLGVTDVITHVGFMPEDPNCEDFGGTVAALRSLTQYMAEKGQYFLFETGQETPVTLLRAIEEIGTGNVGINLDTANLILYGKANTLDALDVIGKYVRNTHIKDGLYPTTGMLLGEETPLGIGKACIEKVVPALKALGYDGPLTIEREISGPKQTEDILLAKEILEKLL